MEPSTPELLTKSLDSVNMLSIQECLQLVCKIPLLARALAAARPSARATIGYLVYKFAAWFKMCSSSYIVGIRPFENKNSSNIFSSEPRLRRSIL